MAIQTSENWKQQKYIPSIRANVLKICKVADKMAYANSGDPDQTAPEGAVWSGSTLFAILLGILRNTCIKNKIRPKMYGIKCSIFFFTVTIGIIYLHAKLSYFVCLVLVVLSFWTFQQLFFTSFGAWIIKKKKKKKNMFTQSIGFKTWANRVDPECGIWLGSILYATHPVVLDTSIGSKMDLFKL